MHQYLCGKSGPEFLSQITELAFFFQEVFKDNVAIIHAFEIKVKAFVLFEFCPFY